MKVDPREALPLARASAFLLKIEENSSQRPLSNQWAEALSLLRTKLVLLCDAAAPSTE